MLKSSLDSCREVGFTPQANQQQLPTVTCICRIRHHTDHINAGQYPEQKSISHLHTKRHLAGILHPRKAILHLAGSYYARRQAEYKSQDRPILRLGPCPPQEGTGLRPPRRLLCAQRPMFNPIDYRCPADTAKPCINAIMHPPNTLLKRSIIKITTHSIMTQS